MIHEGAVLCVLCEFHKQECTFVQSPVPRKRKPTGDGNKEEVSKKRSVECGIEAYGVHMLTIRL